MSNSGLDSLGGFSFQIMVFVLYLLQCDADTSVGFECLDDVSLSPVRSHEDIARYEDSLRFHKTTQTGHQCIQVKKTDVTRDKAEKMLFNWLLCDENAVDQYTLVVDSEDRVRANITDFDYSKLYTKVCNASRRPTALIEKIKAKYNGNQGAFLSDCAYIQERYNILTCANIEDSIASFAHGPLHFGGVKQTTFELRVDSLLEKITTKIVMAANDGISYSCNKVELARLIEATCTDITDDEYVPDFVDFKERRQVYLDDAIKQTREYIQLAYCYTTDNSIIGHLLFNQFYEDFRMRHLENYEPNKLENLELLTFQNFSDTKELLQAENRDIPIRRLLETKQRDNSFAQSEFIRYGSCIFLTRDAQPDNNKISWKDDANAKC